MKIDYTYTKKQRSVSQWLTLCLLSLFMLWSCTGEEDIISSTLDSNDLTTTATIHLSVCDYNQDESGITRSVTATTSESALEDLWLFQFDATTGEQMQDPVYTSSFDAEDIEIELTRNTEGSKSLVCIVANVGQINVQEEGEEMDYWALVKDADDNLVAKDDFKTYEGLLQQTIPSTAAEPFVSSYIASGSSFNGRYIPMLGVTEKTIANKTYVIVPLYRMFARMTVNIDDSVFEWASIKSITFHNVQSPCCVGPQTTDDTYTDAASYPTTVEWVDFESLPATGATVYLPENLQGKVSGMTGKTATADTPIPTNALNIELVLKEATTTSDDGSSEEGDEDGSSEEDGTTAEDTTADEGTDDEGTTEDGGDTTEGDGSTEEGSSEEGTTEEEETTEEETTEEAQTYTYTIYPGLDMDNDFNVVRNYIYNVNIKVSNPNTSDTGTGDTGDTGTGDTGDTGDTGTGDTGDTGTGDTETTTE